MSESAGRYTTVVEIGRIPISLSTGSPAFNHLLRQRYSGFLSSTRAEYELDFDLADHLTTSDVDVRVRRQKSVWWIERGDFRVRWNPQTARGSVEQNPNPYSLDTVLRIMHSLILAGRGGFLLHAASAVCDGQAYLFSGISGAGKTTIARLAPPDVTLLTDEISYVRPRTDGYSAFGTPFAGELAKAGENCSAPLSAVFFLEKGPENRLEELKPSEAVGRLMRNILFFAEDGQLVEKLLATACEFVASVPIRRLMFYPDSRVWDTVRHFKRKPAHV
jgi:hypothetical protein